MPIFYLYDSTIMFLQMEWNLWQSTFNQKAFPTAHPPSCKLKETRLLPLLLLLIQDSTQFLTIYWIFKWQEMVEFLVDIWDQEGLYDWACKTGKLLIFSILSFLPFFLVPICIDCVSSAKVVYFQFVLIIVPLLCLGPLWVDQTKWIIVGCFK